MHTNPRNLFVGIFAYYAVNNLCYISNSYTGFIIFFKSIANRWQNRYNKYEEIDMNQKRGRL